MLFRYGMGEIVIKLISMTRTLDGESWDEVRKLACHVLKGLSVHDDYRKEISCAHENGRLEIFADSLDSFYKNLLKLYQFFIPLAFNEIRDTLLILRPRVKHISLLFSQIFLRFSQHCACPNGPIEEF